MISRVLVANRGEIARRIFRTCREMGIGTVAVFSDVDSGEPHAREADEAVRIPGASPSETYLRIDAVLDAALDSGVDAVHPGYGFLAENAVFARAVIDAGLVWIGPPPKVIEIMGSKLEAKKLMEQSGLPTLDSVEITTTTDVAQAAATIGYPVLVKASAGGGGKGMRIVTGEDALGEAIDGAKREALAAFGDDTVFLERYLEAPRHIEIQVFGDTHGNVIALHERECSIQRRHQKIVEEAPSPAVDEETRQVMASAAVDAAKAVGYIGAGTVEMLFDDGSFYFLEMNTRLQVEHPVTEMVTGLDLVRMQIEVASGSRLPGSPPPIVGHAIEARLYAEDALNDYLPVTGKVHQFDFPASEGIRVDAGVEAGSDISVHYDPMIAKVIGHAPTRSEAAASLAGALRRARVHMFTTNRALLVRILESEDFLSGDIDTHFLERHDAAKLGRPLTDPSGERLAAVAAALADQALERQTAPVLGTLPSGWRNMPAQSQARSYRGFHDTHEIRYSVSGGGFADAELGDVSVAKAEPGLVLLSLDGQRHRFQVARYGELRFVDSDEATVRLTVVPRFPEMGPEAAAGSLHAPMPGKVVRVDVSEGDRVERGQVLVILEAMKMEHALRAPHAGEVARVLHQSGDQVDGNTVLVVVTEI